MVLTFVVVCLTWVVFRAESLGEAGRYYAALFGGMELRGPAWWVRELVVSGDAGHPGPGGAGGLGWRSASRFVAHMNRWKSTAITFLFWISLVVMGAQGANPFLYYFF